MITVRVSASGNSPSWWATSHCFSYLMSALEGLLVLDSISMKFSLKKKGSSWDGCLDEDDSLRL